MKRLIRTSNTPIVIDRSLRELIESECEQLLDENEYMTVSEASSAVCEPVCQRILDSNKASMTKYKELAASRDSSFLHEIEGEASDILTRWTYS